MILRTRFYSPRGIDLVYYEDEYGDRRERPVLTVENYCKWYHLFVVGTDGAVTPVYFVALEDHTQDMAPYVDHAPNPTVVARLAKSRGWHVDEQSYEMIIGRWELEHTDHSKYRLEQ